MMWAVRRLVAVVAFVLAGYGAVAGLLLVALALLIARSSSPVDCQGMCYLSGLSLLYLRAVVLQVLLVGAAASLCVVAIRRRRGTPEPVGVAEMLGSAGTAIAWGGVCGLVSSPILVFTAILVMHLLG